MLNNLRPNQSGARIGRAAMNVLYPRGYSTQYRDGGSSVNVVTTRYAMKRGFATKRAIQALGLSNG